YAFNYNASIGEYASFTAELLAAFEPGDLRASNWIAARLDYHYSTKFKAYINAPYYTEYSAPLRLAEQYLLRAESRAHLGDIPRGMEDINQIRRRAGLPDLNLTTEAPLLQAVEQERRVELFSE